MCAAGSSAAAASRQLDIFFIAPQLSVKCKPPCFSPDLDQFALDEAFQLGSSSDIANDFFAGVPVTQSEQWMAEVTANAYGTSGAEYNSLDNSFCYDSFSGVQLSQPGGIVNALSQLGANPTSNGFSNQLDSSSAPHNSPGNQSLKTSSHDNSPKTLFVSPNSQDNIQSGPSPRASVSPQSSSSKADHPSRIEKRTRNTLAARRYRQKRVDQVSSLESALKETESERDDLKVRVARLEGELEALRGLLKSKG